MRFFQFEKRREDDKQHTITMVKDDGRIILHLSRTTYGDETVDWRVSKGPSQSGDPFPLLKPSTSEKWEGLNQEFQQFIFDQI